jgi:hypothetical protein
MMGHAITETSQGVQGSRSKPGKLHPWVCVQNVIDRPGVVMAL